MGWWNAHAQHHAAMAMRSASDALPPVTSSTNSVIIRPMPVSVMCRTRARRRRGDAERDHVRAPSAIVGGGGEQFGTPRRAAQQSRCGGRRRQRPPAPRMAAMVTWPRTPTAGRELSPSGPTWLTTAARMQPHARLPGSGNSITAFDFRFGIGTARCRPQADIGASRRWPRPIRRNRRTRSAEDSVLENGQNAIAESPTPAQARSRRRSVALSSACRFSVLAMHAVNARCMS